LSSRTASKNESSSRSGAEPKRARRREALAASATGTAVLFASLCNFLSHNEYPLLRTEVAIVAAFIVVLALVVGVLYALASEFGRALLQFLLVFLALDLNFDGMPVAIWAGLIALILNRHMLRFLGITAAAVIATSIASFTYGHTSVSMGAAPTTPQSSNAPILVHVILDGHVGIEGLLRKSPNTSAIREKLKAFYLRNDFRLFGGAYSEDFHSLNSIPRMLNFGIEQPESARANEVQNNAYFDRLASLGYRPHVIQTDFLSYCAADIVASCRSRRFVDLAVVANAGLSSWDKAHFIAMRLASLARLLRIAANRYDSVASWATHQGFYLPPVRLDEKFNPAVIGALADLDQLSHDLKQALPGAAYFAHVMLPHEPYITNGSCQLKGLSDWQNRSPDPDDSQELAYLDQVSCALTKVQSLLDALASSAAGKNAIIIIHGDHGSRLASKEPRENTIGEFGESDLINAYSTLFAVRASNIESGYDARPLPVSRLLEALSSADFLSADIGQEAGFVPTVALENGDFMPGKRHPLPTWWAVQ